MKRDQGIVLLSTVGLVILVVCLFGVVHSIPAAPGKGTKMEELQHQGKVEISNDTVVRRTKLPSEEFQSQHGAYEAYWAENAQNDRDIESNDNKARNRRGSRKPRSVVLLSLLGEVARWVMQIFKEPSRNIHKQIPVNDTLQFTRRPPRERSCGLGERVLLPCETTGATSIAWRRNNKTLPVSAVTLANGTLVIPAFSLEYAGDYTCTARNVRRAVTATVALRALPPKSCSELKRQSPMTPSGNYVIDPDGQSGEASLQVYCDMSDKRRIGVTIVDHDSEAKTLVDGFEGRGSYRRDIHYNGATMAQLSGLTRVSKNCEQFVEFECNNDVRFINGQYGWWVSRNGVNQYYWGGATPGSYSCACGMTNSCSKDWKRDCNCNNKNTGKARDSGLLTDKSALPVSQLRFGDTGDSQEQGWHTLGRFKCYGSM